MQIPKETDVLIVGGGPGGVIPAIMIARAGYGVVILDKKRREDIGNKTCGEALDKPAPILFKEKLDIDFPSGDELRTPLEYLSFASVKISTKLKATTPAFIVNRHAYGQKLLRAAEESGTKIFGQVKVRDVLLRGDQVIGVRYYTGNRQAEIRAKIVIDASGFVATVRKSIPAEVRKSNEYEVPDRFTVATYREIIEFQEEHEFRKEALLWYVKEIPAPGYAWIFTSGEKRLNIGLTWPKDVEYPAGKSLKDIFHDIFDKIYSPGSYQVIHSGGGQIPIRVPFASAVFNGVILVGDAGCFVDPTTAEGHGPALLSGYHAGETAIEALKKESYRIEDLWTFNVRTMRTLGKVSGMSQVFQSLMREIQAEGIYKVLKKQIFSQEDLEEMFQKDDFELTLWEKIVKVLKMFPHYALLWKIYKAVQRVEQASQLYESYPDTPAGIEEWVERRDSLLGISFE